jgi:hypothetical protein
MMENNIYDKFSRFVELSFEFTYGNLPFKAIIENDVDGINQRKQSLEEFKILQVELYEYIKAEEWQL